MAGGTLILIGLVLSAAALIVLCWVLVRRMSWSAMLVALGIIVFGAWIFIWRYSHRAESPHVACSLPKEVGELGALCGFDDPEDLELVPSRSVVIVSEERLGGRLLKLDPQHLDAGPSVLWPVDYEVGMKVESPVGDPTCDRSPNPQSLYLHGISVSDGSARRDPIRVAAVAHSERETIQFFDLNEAATRLEWRGCIFYPEHTTGNDVALLADGSLLATNYAPTGVGAEGSKYRLRGGVGIDTGDVLAWSPSGGWTHIPNTNGALPNGIAAARDESTFYFADAGAWRIAIVPRHSSKDAYGGIRIHVGGAPDNLSVNKDGRLLTAVMNFSGDLPILCAIGGRECHSGWAVWEVDPASRSASELVADSGRILRTATSALEVGNFILIGSMDDDRIGVFRRY